jgi:glycosyltransferase involved in cell wall biosynthesis
MDASGGAERVLVEVVHALPDVSRVYVLRIKGDRSATRDLGIPVTQSVLGASWLPDNIFNYLLPLMPLVWRFVPVGDARMVFTSSYATVNSIPRRDGVERVSYCHTPMRYAWEPKLESGRVPAISRPMLGLVSSLLRRWDRRWSTNVDHYITNSQFVAERIQRAYRREAEVLWPPVRTDIWTPGDGDKQRTGFLAIGRLVPYKRFDIAIQAANESGATLTVVGQGPERSRLERMAGPTVRFLGSVDDFELAELYRSSVALIFPGVEDFGIVALEAQASGTPVIGARAGGLLETVVDGITGILVTQAVSATVDAMRRVDATTFSPADCRKNAMRFDRTRFVEKLADLSGGELPPAR